jgi:hypothetical protein
MTDVYRVLVVRENTGSLSEVLFEAASPDADRLLDYAPAEVVVALTAVSQRAEVLTSEAVMSALPAPQPVDEPVEAADDKPKRTRRTKAEIAAAKAAGVTVSTSFEGAVPVPTSPLPAEASSPLAEPLPQEAPAPAAGVFNPFA